MLPQTLRFFFLPFNADLILIDVSLQYSSFIKFLNGTNIVFVLVGFLKLSTLSFMAINLILNSGNICSI